ncbi:MAG: hypothetical protein JWO94_3617, partial [Verrucomicrobiaceae bacterium]|nr:hypothetical protein [Verrucomicrobiaceae bacterium]
MLTINSLKRLPAATIQRRNRVTEIPNSSADPAPLSSAGSRFRYLAPLLLVVPVTVIIGLICAGRQKHHEAALSDSWQGLLKVCAVEISLFGVLL